MTIRYKADHTIKRSVTPLTPGASWWVGHVDDYYSNESWEPVPEKRWVLCPTWVLDDGATVNVSGMPEYILMAKGQRAVLIAPGTVRFEREGEE